MPPRIVSGSECGGNLPAAGGVPLAARWPHSHLCQLPGCYTWAPILEPSLQTHAFPTGTGLCPLGHAASSWDVTLATEGQLCGRADSPGPLLPRGFCVPRSADFMTLASVGFSWSVSCEAFRFRSNASRLRSHGSVPATVCGQHAARGISSKGAAHVHRQEGFCLWGTCGLAAKNRWPGDGQGSVTHLPFPQLYW